MTDRLVTIFGGGGFVGTYVVQALLTRGWRVRIAERDPRSALHLKPLGGLGQTQFVAADITRPETLARAVDGAQAVINLVGILKGDFERVHVAGTRAAAAAADAAGARRFVQISAIGADLDSPSAYGRSKALGEEAVRGEFPAATILRPSIVFGREDQFVNRFARMIAAAPVVPVLRAEAKFQPVYVADLAEAVANALDHDDAAGATYEIGGPDVITMGALIRWIAQAIGRERTIIDLPDSVGALIAGAGFLPGAPITADQWKMLQSDNVVATDARTIADLGVAPVPMASVAPGWLIQYRRLGRFGRKAG